VTRLLLVAALLVPTGAWSAPDDADERRVAKRIKEAEREGYQRRELDTYFSIYTQDASWTFGRRAVSDEHDYTLANGRYRTQLEGRWQGGASGQDRVFFRTLEVKLSGSTGTAEGELARHFFGGSERLGRLYRLVKKGPNWRVSAVRTWHLETIFGPDVRIYNDEYLLEADEKAARAKSDEGKPFSARIADLIAAGWISSAYAIAKAQVKPASQGIEVLRARAQLGFTLGEFRDARRAAKALRRLDPTAQLPPGL